jgi:WD40 repeat protein
MEGLPMPAADTRGEAARVFISYSLQDGAQVAADLREWLLRENLSVWQDRNTLQGGRDWWSQIEDALKSKPLQHMVLVVTPGALASPVVRREIRLARQEGKTVSPVRGPGLGDFHSLPRWLGQIYDLDLPEHRTTLIRVLQGQSVQTRVAMMAPEPPADFVARPAEFGALKQQLLDAKGDAVAITAALRGAGGYGKTTLAKKLAHDEDIQDAYFDGILWVELGEKPGNLLSIMSDLVEILSGERPGLENVTSAAAKLGEALGDRRILLVIDDVWRAQDLRPLLHGGRSTTRLITTRNDHVLPDEALRQQVDAMRQSESLELLAAGLPNEQAAILSKELGALTKRLGEWAQLLKIVNGFLRDRVMKNRQPLAQAIKGVNQRLTEKGLRAFDAKNEADRTKTIAYTIEVSLDLLDPESRTRFGELGVFPEGVDVPIGIIARFWKESGDLDVYAAEDLLSELYGLSLLQGLDLDQRTVRLHDNVRRFLQEQAKPQGLVALHQGLVHALVRLEKLNEPGAQRYYYLYLPQHLADAGDDDALKRLLLDPDWLVAKLAALRDPQSLVADFDGLGLSEAHDLIGRALRLTSGICAREPRQLLPQLLGRLTSFEEQGLSAFLQRARERIQAPAILTSRPSLTPPGPEIARLEGHWSWVYALCLLSDGRLASGSEDRTIRVWDLKTGTESVLLEGHTDSVNALCMLPDGQLASGASDNVIQLWDVTTGVKRVRLEGHAGGVNALCMLSDGRLASGSDDKAIRLWDVKTGAESARLKGHSGGVNALCMLPDGRLASGSGDTTIRLWDVKTGTESARFEGHSGGVNALCVLQDGRLASGSDDQTIRLWDVRTGAERARLEGHAHHIETLCTLPDGRLVSGSNDLTVRTWDVELEAEVGRLGTHIDRIGALCVMPDGRIASGSYRAIRLWDVQVGAEHTRLGEYTAWVTALCLLGDGRLASGSYGDVDLWNVQSRTKSIRLRGHSGYVGALCMLADGRLASGSWDNEIRLWDLKSIAESVRLGVHTDWVRALCALDGNRLASGANDGMISVWDVTSCVRLARLEGHTSGVRALCMLPDGRLASGSLDHTIRFWDLASATECARLSTALGIAALCVLPDGRLASGSWSSMIQLWDTQSTSEALRLEGHHNAVSALCALPDGRLASGSHDNTIRLWDIEACKEVCRLEVDAPILCLAVLPDGHLVAGDELGRLHWLEILT